MFECGSDWISFLFQQAQSVNNVESRWAKGKMGGKENQFPGEKGQNGWQKYQFSGENAKGLGLGQSGKEGRLSYRYDSGLKSCLTSYKTALKSCS